MRLKARVLGFTVLALVLFGLGLGTFGCGEESTEKSCTTREDCGPCEFCNMGVCKKDPYCTPCDDNGSCPAGMVCNFDYWECEEDTGQFPDGDEDKIDLLDGTDESGPDNPDATTEVEDSLPPTDGDEELPPVDGDDDEVLDPDSGFEDVERWEPRELEFDFESTTQCEVTGTPGPEITVIPAERVVNFGAVMVGDYKIEYVTVCNSGGQPFNITNITLSHDTSTLEFQIRHDPTPITLNSGEGIVIAVVYQPLDNQNDTGHLLVLSTSNEPEVDITLIGQIKPVGRLDVQPEILQFYFQGATKTVALTNVGVANLAVLQLRIEDPNNPPLFFIDNPTGNGPWPLAPNERMDVAVRFSGGQGAQDATLHIIWNNGEGNLESIVELQAGGDIQCAIPNAGPDQQVAPLAVVQLDGSLSVDPNDTMQPGENWYFWDFVSKPPGAPNANICESVVVDAANHRVICNNNVQGRWSPVAKPQFFAEVAGTYVVMLRINPHDDPGCDVFDTVTINAVPDETIHIQLRWDTPNNDHDLHLVRYSTPSMMGQIGCFSRGDIYNGNDCHWENCNTQNGTAAPCPPRGCPGPFFAPDWGTINQRVDDPTLDIDDIPGTGPENINLSLPEIGDYFVAVEYYSGSDIPSLTVKVWIFGVLVQQWNGIKITAGPQHHWNVCWIHVNSETDIQVEEIGVNNKPSNSNDCNPTQP